jgi:hypothetical protein
MTHSGVSDSVSASCGARLSSASPSPTLQALAFFETLVTVLPVRSVSDRTCFRRVVQWLAEGVGAGRLGDGAFAEALLYTREACLGKPRSPHAVFLSILRKELGYDPKRRKGREGLCPPPGKPIGWASHPHPGP